MLLIVMSISEPEAWSLSAGKLKVSNIETSSSDDSSDDDDTQLALEKEEFNKKLLENLEATFYKDSPFNSHETSKFKSISASRLSLTSLSSRKGSVSSPSKNQNNLKASTPKRSRSKSTSPDFMWIKSLKRI